MIYGIQFDSSGNPISGWEAPDSAYPVPVDVTLCTEAQNADYLAWTLVNGSLVQSLSATQTAQIALLRGGYANANAANISFTNAAGLTDTYQCDSASLMNLQNCLSGFRAAAAVPSGFYWRSATNNNNPFTYADLENLSAAIAARGFANYNQMQTLIAKVKAAKKVSAVQAVVWVNP